MDRNRKRVVITGMGAVTPLGQSVEEYWKNLVRGVSGIAPITLCDASPFPCRIAGEVKGFDPEQHMNPKEARRMARFSQLAVAAAGLAIKDAWLDMSKEDPERMGVVMGNGNGGFPTTEENARVLVDKGGMRMSPFFIPMILPNMAAANVSRLYGLKGYTSTVITACAAGNQAIGDAAEAIRRGVADVVLGGGCEAGISQLGLGGFNVIKALSRQNDPPEKASRPFDAKRDGFIPAEGAAILVMESLEHALRRNANILAELVGYGVSSDAFHMVEPDQDGAGAARAMRWALEDAGLGTDELDYINAHGTSTPKNDAVETLAIKKVFGERAYRIPISSTKSMIGHTLGGAGALEAVACIKTILHNEVHPTINYEFPDPDCDLDYVPNVARQQRVDTVLSNSFGFGGQNACLVFKRFQG
jgi:3-oxoacyl-[acyl-carrier-protein] synthase II